MPPQTPYSSDLGSREPIATIRETIDRVRELVGKWTPAQFERSYAPGKWTARQILTHLAQTELALGTRARMALSTPNYTAQPFDQDLWMRFETSLSGAEALNAFATMARMNAALYGSLTETARQTPLAHPEYGALTVEWIIYQTAGHQIHHLKQLEIVRA